MKKSSMFNLIGLGTLLAALTMPVSVLAAIAHSFWWGKGSTVDWATAGNWWKCGVNATGPSGSTTGKPETNDIKNYAIFTTANTAGSYKVNTGSSVAQMNGHILVNGGLENNPFTFYGKGVNLGNKADYMGFFDVAFKDNYRTPVETECYAKIQNGTYTCSGVQVSTTTAPEYVGHLAFAQESSDLTFTIKGSLAIVNGEVTLSGNPTVNLTSCISVCKAADCTGRLVVGGGTISQTANHILIGDTVAGSTGIVDVNGGTLSTANNIYVGQYGNGTLTVSGTGLVDVGGNVVFSNVATGSDTANDVVNLNGGTLRCTQVKRGVGPAATATFNFNGGTLQARQSGTLIADHDDLSVLVGDNGGIIDAAKYSVQIAAPLAAAAGSSGGMTFKGGSDISIAAVASYAGATTIEMEGGTLLIAPSYAVAASLFENGVVAELPDHIYGDVAIMTIGNLDEVFTEDDLGNFSFADQERAEREGASFAVSNDGKSVMVRFEDPGYIWTGNGGDGKFSTAANWMNELVPTNNASLVISVAGPTTIIQDMADYSPWSITFGEDSAVVTLVQNEGVGSLVGRPSFINLGTVHHEIAVPVTIAAAAEPGIDFGSSKYFVWTGGLTIDTLSADDGDTYVAGNVIVRNEWKTSERANASIVGGATLTVPSLIQDTDPEIEVAAGATFVVTGDVTLTATAVYERIIVDANNGTVRVGGTVTSTGKADPRLCHSGNGVFYVYGFVENSSGEHFKLNAKVNQPEDVTLHVGAGGLVVGSAAAGAGKSFWHEAKRPGNYIYPMADYSVGRVQVRYPNNNTDVISLTFGTTDPDTGVDYTVTQTAGYVNDGCIKIIGGGRYVIKESSTMMLTPSTFAQPTFEAADTVTIEVVGGKQICGGNMVFGGGTTLEVANPAAGAITAVTNLTLGTGFTLASNGRPATATDPFLAVQGDLKLVDANNLAVSEMTIAVGGEWLKSFYDAQKLIGWNAQPEGVAFSLPIAQCKDFYIKSKEDGLYLYRKPPMAIFFR